MLLEPGRILEEFQGGRWRERKRKTGRGEEGGTKEKGRDRKPLTTYASNLLTLATPLLQIVVRHRQIFTC